MASRAARDYASADELGHARCTELVQRFHLSTHQNHPLGCWDHRTLRGNSDGYVQVSYTLNSRLSTGRQWLTRDADQREIEQGNQGAKDREGVTDSVPAA